MKTAAIMAMFLAAALNTPALAQTQAQLNQLHQQQLRQLRLQQQAEKRQFQQQRRNFNRVYNNNNRWFNPYNNRTSVQQRIINLRQQIGNTMDAGQKAALIQQLHALEGRW